MKGVNLSSAPSVAADLVSAQDLSTGIKIIHSGTLAPQSSIVEIKTRRLFPGQIYNVDECIRALFFSQTSRLFLGCHDRGRFNKIFNFELKNLGTEQRMLKSDIYKAVELLKSIKQAMLKTGAEKRMSLVFSSSKHEFAIYENNGGVGLPKELKEYFK